MADVPQMNLVVLADDDGNRMRIKVLGPSPCSLGIQLVDFAQARWRATTGPHLVSHVRAGARFENGVLVKRSEAAA
ncbi:hypothetical protein ACQB60_40715 [Actinomycetota bacterium Odt1-20B]